MEATRLDDNEDLSDETPPDEQTARNAVVLLAIVIEGGLILLAVLLGWLLDRRPLDRVRFESGAALAGVAATVPMLIAFLTAMLFPVGPFRAIKAFLDGFIRPLMAPCTWIDLLGISILAGLGEELLFRGLLQDAFAAWLPVWAAVSLAALLFGLMHAVTRTYALMATIIGAYLGWLYIATDNLLAPIVAHALYDFVLLLVLLRGPGSQPPTTPDDEETPPHEP